MTPTAKQEAWINRVQKALNSKGGAGLGFYTIGDQDVSIYDKSKQAAIDEWWRENPNSEFCQAVSEADAYLGQLLFPDQVESAAG